MCKNKLVPIDIVLSYGQKQKTIYTVFNKEGLGHLPKLLKDAAKTVSVSIYSAEHAEDALQDADAGSLITETDSYKALIELVDLNCEYLLATRTMSAEQLTIAELDLIGHNRQAYYKALLLHGFVCTNNTDNSLVPLEEALRNVHSHSVSLTGRGYTVSLFALVTYVTARDIDLLELSKQK